MTNDYPFWLRVLGETVRDRAGHGVMSLCSLNLVLERECRTSVF